MRPRHRRLGHQRPRRTLLGVRVGNVESHPPGPARADLDVRSRAVAPHPFHQDLDVPRQLRHRLGQQVPLDRREVHRAAGGRLAQRPCRPVHVLIGERGRRVDAVHHHVRPVALQHLDEEAAADHLFGEVAVHVLDQQPPVLGPVRQLRAVGARQRGREVHVAVLGRDGGRPREGPEGSAGLLDLPLGESHDHDGLGTAVQEPERHRVAHQPASAENHDRRASQLHRDERLSQ